MIKMQTKTKLTLTIDKDLAKKFKQICEEYGYKMSTKVERFIKEFIERGKKR